MASMKLPVGGGLLARLAGMIRRRLDVPHVPFSPVVLFDRRIVRALPCDMCRLSACSGRY